MATIFALAFLGSLGYGIWRFFAELFELFQITISPSPIGWVVIVIVAIYFIALVATPPLRED